MVLAVVANHLLRILEAVVTVIANSWGGTGASGVVILRYPDSQEDLTTVGAGLTYTKTTSGGYKIYSFTAGTGSITV